ncbi:hypothetical protein XELAEV_18019401mg [Xenopus laevis]|uniref:Uncharacterized protein n=1 Tax=Xenopus laevis TaxID=8355 RepID=A0A974HUI0_XENLA|nr:hypothetical protein XELAEV_18019401mg [Xenopus laevis]
MARRPDLEDSTAAILSLASMLLDSVSERCVAEPVDEPEVPEIKMEPLPCATTRVEPRAAVCIPSERGMMIPGCGVCNMEAPNALEDPDCVCLQCEARLWMGPFNRADQPPLVEKRQMGHSYRPAGRHMCTPLHLCYGRRSRVTFWSCLMPTPLIVPAPVLDAPGGEVCTPSAIGAPACCVPAPVPMPENYLKRVRHVLEADAACRPEAAPVSSEEECLQPVPMLGEEDLSDDLNESSAPMGVKGTTAVHVKFNSAEPDTSPEVKMDCTLLHASEKECFGTDWKVSSVLCPKEDPSPRRVWVSDSGPGGDLTVTIYTALAVPTPTPVIGHDVDWSKFSFGRLGPIAPIAPTIRDHPILEEDENLLEKLISSSVNSDGESILEIPAQIRCQRRLGPVPGWEEYEENTPTAEPEWDPPPEVPRSFVAPPIIGPEEEKDFWADPNVFTSVSRTVINFHVHRPWGYSMPYAPLWVYEKLAATYENWLIDEILWKKKMNHSCLTNPDKVRREQDWQYLSSIKKEWWYGHTILKNAVKSCGKYNPTKYFNLGVYIGDPHPKYYIPYEDTKARFFHMI